MVLKPIAILVALGIIAGLALTFREDISQRLQKEKTPEEIEQQKKQNERGALANTQAFIFGETSLIPSLVPPKTGLFTEQQNKRDSRGAFANTVAFLGGEGALRPDERLPTGDTPTTKQETKTFVGDAPEKLPTEPNKVRTEPTRPTRRNSNVVPKLERTNSKFESTKRRGRPVPQPTLTETTPTTRESNVVRKKQRQLSGSRRRGKLPVEPNTVLIQKAEENQSIG